MPSERTNDNRKWTIDVDIPVLIMLFGLNLTENVLTNFIIYRTCYVTLHFNQSECALLSVKNLSSNMSELQEQVQPTASILLMSRTVTDAIIPACLGLFLGPWSDKHGRKPLIIGPILGQAVYMCLLTVLTFFPYSSPWFIVVASIPVSFFGGISAFLTGIFCYISDLVPVHDRAVRIGILQGMLTLGLLIGQLLSGPLFHHTNYTVVFIFGAIAHIISVLYCIFLLPESVENRREPEGIRGLINCENVRDIMRTCFKQRSQYRRFVIWTILSILGLMVATLYGNMQNTYLFIMERFHWSLEKYSIYSSLASVVSIVGSMIGVYILNKILKISEVILGIISFSSAIVSSLMKAFAYKDWQLFATIPASTFEGMGSPMCRSILSKTVPENELGKVFAMASSIEALVPLICVPIYTYLYNKTLIELPGAFYILSAAIYLICDLLFGSLLCTYDGNNDTEDRLLIVNAEENDVPENAT